MWGRPAVTVSSPPQRSLPAFSSSPGTTPENTPPFAARGHRDASRPTATRRYQIPVSRALPDDARARIHSERECIPQFYSAHLLRLWPQSGLNPTPAREAIARNPPRTQDCRTPATLPVTESHLRVPAPSTARSTRSPAEAAAHAANSRSPTFLPA